MVSSVKITKVLGGFCNKITIPLLY